MSETVYAYQDLNRNTTMVDAGDINYTGTWSSSGTYFEATKDVVLYGSSRFIAIVDNVGGVPTYIPRRGQAKWSSLVVVRQGTETGHTADEAWNLANTANNAASAAVNTANAALAATVEGAAAYDIAVDGTNAAYRALQMAWSGTNGADAAFSVAVAGTNSAAQAATSADRALQTAWSGTSIANRALQTAWSGTSGANSAFAIAVAGTNAAAAAAVVAAGAQQGVNTLASWFGTIAAPSSGSAYAFGLFVAGTNYANGRDEIVVQNGSQFSTILRDQGTNYTDQQVAIVGQQAGANAFDLYIAGTNYTNSVAFQSAGSASQLVFEAGTNYTNDRVAAEAAARVNGDNSIIAIAVAGTNAAALADAHAQAALAAAWAGTTASLPLTGGTLSGNLRAPQVFLGAGTTPTSQAINGTIYYDFLGPAFQETTVDMNLVVSAKNYTPGAEISAVLVSNGNQRTLAYDAAFSWFGTQVPMTSAVANKKVLVALASTGTTPSNVLGASTPQL